VDEVEFLSHFFEYGATYLKVGVTFGEITPNILKEDTKRFEQIG